MAGTKANGNKTTAKGKKPSGTKASGGRTSGTKSTKQTQNQDLEEGFLRSEVLIIGSFALAVLLFLSNFHLCGIAGDYLRMAQLGVFGMIGFVAPVILFVGTCFALANKGNPIATLKLVSVIAAVILLCGLAEMFFGEGFKEGQKAAEAFFRSSESGLGGGFIGGLLVIILGSMLGTIGTYLVLFVLLAICGVCITEKSLVALVKKEGGKAYRYAREDVERKRIVHEERKEEKKRLREERKLRGVDLSSTKLDAWVDEPGNDSYENHSDYEEQDSCEDYSDYEKPDSYGEYPGYEEPSGYEADDRYVAYEEYDRSLNPARREQNEEREYKASPADVFTGTIHMANSYAETEDKAPFDADRTIDVSGRDKVLQDNRKHENGQELHVQRDLRTLGEMEMTDDYCVPWNSGGQKTSDESEKYNDSRQTSVFDDWAGRFHERNEFCREEPDYTDRGNEEFYNISHNRENFGDKAFHDREFGYGNSIGRNLYDGNTRYENQANQDLYEASPNDSETGYSCESTSGAAELQNIYKEETGYEPEEDGDYEFSIPEESKRVVTATGKIIESDTEALKKKVERRREEAIESGGVIAPRQMQEEMVTQKPYEFPSVELLKKGKTSANSASDKEYRETAIKLQQTLRNFGVGVTVTNVSCGPSVTRYELHPEQGVKVSKIVGLADDIKLNLAAADIRIEAPIPGKSAVGIEVPNKENNVVYLRELLESEEFKNHKSKLAFAVGKDIGGQVVVTDVAKMPHLLIAGATGSGKSVCINTLIMSLIYKSDPNDVKMIMIDPKVVELSAYNGIPHLLIPVVTDPKKASGALNWAVAEMMDRYQKFAQYNVRNLQGYNAKVEAIKDIEDDNKPQKMPLIVIIVDELADLMMVSPGEVEDAICRLAQLARAAGIHLVIATQRPSVNVITGLIKANVPSRIAFSVSSGVDSRTIIDMYGAEKLLGKGDMLFYPSGYQKPQRVQGAFVSDQEVSGVVEFLTAQNEAPVYRKEIESQIAMPVFAGQAEAKGNGRDEYFAQAGKFIIEKEKGSIGMLQRMFKIGFNRAARIMDQLAEAGVVGEEEGTKPRRVLMTLEEFQEMLNQEG